VGGLFVVFIAALLSILAVGTGALLIRGRAKARGVLFWLGGGMIVAGAIELAYLQLTYGVF
jgi:hypothetical protein